MIRLEAVNKVTFWEVIKLKVGKEQIDFIESNAQSIAESKYYEYWKPMCIFNDETIIGFTMYGKCEDDSERIWLDRFMIDKEYQGRGLGKKSLKYIIDILGKEYECTEIYISIFEDNKAALKMYKKEGFKFNGEFDYGGEKVMVKVLDY